MLHGSGQGVCRIVFDKAKKLSKEEGKLFQIVRDENQDKIFTPEGRENFRNFFEYRAKKLPEEIKSIRSSK